MSDSPADRHYTQSRLPYEELARDACLAMIFHLLSSCAAESNDEHWEHKRALLLADYARRSDELLPELQSRLDRAVISSFDVERGPMDVGRLALPKKAAVDVAIVTILSEELKATLDAFNIKKVPHGGQPFYETKVVCQGRPDRALDVVVTSVPRSLNVHVASAIARLRNKYSPNAVFLVGTAKSQEGKAKQGDIVIAQRVFCYEAGRPKWAEPRNPSRNGLYSYDPKETKLYSRIREFIAELPTYYRPSSLLTSGAPIVYRADTTIAAGESVQCGGELREGPAQKLDDTICAVHQESYAFADAVHGLPWAIFCGISDTGDQTQDDPWKYTTAGLAALCLRDFLETFYVPPDVADL